MLAVMRNVSPCSSSPAIDAAASSTVADRRRWPYAVALIGITCFSITLPATVIALADFSSVFITGFRGVVAAGLGISVLLLWHRAQPTAAERQDLVLSGLLLVFGFPLCIALAMQTVPASHGAVVLGLLPLMTLSWARVLLGEIRSPAFWGWAALGATIVVSFVVWKEGISWALGDFWVLSAAACASLGYVLSNRRTRGRPGWWVISWMVVLMLPLSLLITVLWWPPFFWARPLSSLSALVSLGVVSMYLGFVAWNAALQAGGVGRISQVQLLQVFITLGLSAWFVREPLESSVVLTACAVTLCVMMGRHAESVRLARVSE
ncbi:MAG: DMT family transporter [Litorivicinaceae bacterium]